MLLKSSSGLTAIAKTAVTALTQIRGDHVSGETAVCTLPGTRHAEIYLMFCFPDMYVLVLWSSTNYLTLCSFRSYAMNVNQLQDYTTMTSFFLTLLITAFIVRYPIQNIGQFEEIPQ